MLNDIVFYIELLEYSGNVIGTVAFLWATVVMLGGFCSLLSRLDFWFATVMVFMEGTRCALSIYISRKGILYFRDLSVSLVYLWVLPLSRALADLQDQIRCLYMRVEYI